MTDKPIEISFDEARAVAEEQALHNLKSFVPDTNTPVLAERHLEAAHCWMFFQNPVILVPTWALLGIKWAYVVSKRGTFSQVADFSHAPEQLYAYLQKMSDYFERRGE